MHQVYYTQEIYIVVPITQNLISESVIPQHKFMFIDVRNKHL